MFDYRSPFQNCQPLYSTEQIGEYKFSRCHNSKVEHLVEPEHRPRTDPASSRGAGMNAPDVLRARKALSRGEALPRTILYWLIWEGIAPLPGRSWSVGTDQVPRLVEPTKRRGNRTSTSALGAVGLDGALADEHHRRLPAQRRHRPQAPDGHRGQRPVIGMTSERRMASVRTVGRCSQGRLRAVPALLDTQSMRFLRTIKTAPDPEPLTFTRSALACLGNSAGRK